MAGIWFARITGGDQQSNSWAEHTSKPRSVVSDRPIDIWKRKLEHLQKAEAMASDPAAQFTIREQIKDAQRHIADLESGLSVDDPEEPPRTMNPASPNSVQPDLRGVF